MPITGSESPEIKWKMAKGLMRASLGDEIFYAWIDPIELEKTLGKVAYFLAPVAIRNKAAVRHLERILESMRASGLDVESARFSSRGERADPARKDNVPLMPFLYAQIPPVAAGDEPETLSSKPQAASITCRVSRVWPRIVARLKSECDEETFRKKFEELEIESCEGGALRLSSSRQFIADWPDMFAYELLLDLIQDFVPKVDCLEILPRPKDSPIEGLTQ